MAHFGQQQAFLQRKCLEAQTISMKPVEQSDLAIVRSVFQDSTAVKFFESGSTTVDADWIKGGKMFDRFQDWVRRSYNNELGWWIVYTKQFEVIGLIGLKHEKQTNSIEVSILFNEAFHHEQFVVEAICHLYWHYSQTLYLEESQVVLAVHVNNAFCQRCVSCFGLSLVSTSQHFFTYKGLVKNVMLQHNASVMDQVQGFLRQATSVASPAAASSSPLSSVARMARIDYNTSWKQKLISCNAKKVEFLNAAESQVPDEGEFLPCIDTNQLTTIGTVIVHKPLQGQMLTVSVAITSEDGSLILQANKSKRRKNSQHTTEKLESSTVTIDQDGCAEIRIQAANVLKSGTKRQKCYAVIELKRGAEILEQFSTEPFYIIAKLNYKNYEKTSVIAAPAKASVSSASVSSANSAFTKQGQPCAKRARLAVKKEEVVKAASPVIAQQQAIDDDFLQLNQQEFMPSFMTPQAMNAPIVSNDFMQFNMNFAQPQQPPMYAIPQYAQPQPPLVHYAHHAQHHNHHQQQQPMQFMDVLNNVYYEKQAMAQSLAPIVFEGNNANSSAGDFLDIELQSVNAGQNDAVCCAVEQQQNQAMSNAQIDQFLDMLANNPAPIVSNNNNGINSGDFIKEWNYGFF